MNRFRRFASTVPAAGTPGVDAHRRSLFPVPPSRP